MWGEGLGLRARARPQHPLQSVMLGAPRRSFAGAAKTVKARDADDALEEAVLGEAAEEQAFDAEPEERPGLRRLATAKAPTAAPASARPCAGTRPSAHTRRPPPLHDCLHPP